MIPADNQAIGLYGRSKGRTVGTIGYYKNNGRIPLLVDLTSSLKLFAENLEEYPAQIP